MARFETNRFSSTKQDWETPEALFKTVNVRYNLDFDLAASEENTKCDEYFTREDDALSREWSGRCWLNPPYGGSGKNRLSLWVKKAYEESMKNTCMVAMLIPARTNTVWWHDYCMKASEILLIKGRPIFKGCKYGLPQPLAVIIFGNDTQSLRVSSISCS